MCKSWALCVLATAVVLGNVRVEGEVVVVATPVLYTNNDGGGNDELQAPLSGTASKMYIVCDQSCTVDSAWYDPLDNIRDMNVIRHVDITVQDNTITLIAGGYKESGRVRIKIFASITT